MKSYKALMKLQRHPFLTSALEVGAWLASRSARFTPEKRTPLPIRRLRML